MTSPQDKTHNHSLHISHVKWTRKREKKNIQPMGNREEPHPRNWKQSRYHKINQRIRIYFRNSKRKGKQNSYNYNITRLSIIQRKGQSGNSRLQQNRPKPRPDPQSRLEQPGY